MSLTPRQHVIMAQMQLMRSCISRNMSELQSMHMKYQALESEWLAEELRKHESPPSSPRATTCTASNQASDRAGGAGREEPDHETRSEEESADESRVRDEPEVEDSASGAPAGAVETLPPLPARDLSPRAKKREAILDRWAAGKRSAEICAELGVTPHSVQSIVSTARNNGDKRAVRRWAPRPPGTDERRAEIIRLRREGKTYREIQAETGAVPKTIRAAIAEAERTGELAPGSEPAAEPTPEPAQSIPAPAPSTPEPAPQAPEKPAQPAPVDIGEGHVVVVINGAVHARGGVEDRFRPKESAVLTHMAKGELFHEFTLCGKAGNTDEGVFRYLMNGMRPKLAAIGVELFQPMKRHWRIRELEDGA